MSHIRVPGRSRHKRLLGELALALPPTATVLIVLLLLEHFTHQKILFASLAASAFLIYLDPRHRVNSVRVMVSAQVLGALAGSGAALALGPGFLAAAIAMCVVIVLIVLLNIVHPPAISTAVGFAFTAQHARVTVVFFAALVLVAILVLLQRISLWVLDRVEPFGGDGA